MNNYDVITVDTLVVGSGAAGYNAACRMKEIGKKQVALITEGINLGTSRNTGSDKQTYYKLGLGGNNPDCVKGMAENLFSPGCVDGDNALCEAALSARCFMHLAELGVAFPVNRYGEYIGYKTDHDPFARATSAGPLTSKFMTEALQKQADKLGVDIYDDLLAVEILKDSDGVCGLVCLNTKIAEFTLFRCANIILCTGGPAGIYADSVYPECHTGSTGLALSAGAAVQNFTEWQYGLASIAPRWNVSGTYMQVLPKFVSVDENGTEREFLLDFFDDEYEALSAVFLKGYQWPFDSKKVLNGSSVIDLLVYKECVLLGRKVFLDYRENPFYLKEINYERLIPEAYEYLKNAQSCFGKPIDRLLKMNKPAVDLYSGKGVELTDEMLEIALCAQHNNGGIAVDMWWQSEIPGLFAAGECAGTHGITRPGGSALNAGQVGSLRAAQFASSNSRCLINADKFEKIACDSMARHAHFCERMLCNDDNIEMEISLAQRRMSDNGAAIRNRANMLEAREQTKALLQSFEEKIGVQDKAALFNAYKLKDILISQLAALSAMIDYAEVIGDTRGSALCCDENGELRDRLDELFRFIPAKNSAGDRIQEIRFDGIDCNASWRNVRPLPDNNDFFENIWRTYRENGNIY